MFKPERPIESEEEDFLGRKVFSNDLGKALLNWKEDESLVLGIYGKWGSGKTSIINLAKKYIKGSNKDNKPTIIEFNPWAFSDSNNLGNNFFLELAKQLDMKGFGEKDKEIANKLAYYGAILNFVPSEVTIPGFVNVVLAVFTVISFSVPFWFANIVIDFIGYIFGAILLLVNLSKGILGSVINLFEKRSIYKQKSITQLKEEIKQELASRDRKLLIVIDDIDRLNKSEIHEIFRLVRVNADFPNTIYLLSFDREIIEANLEESPGISGKDYLEKIVQVNLDVPYVNKNKIDKFLFKELDRILEGLPKKALTFFGNDSYWSNIYHSGLGDFFRNVRDVKRFINGLEFNITLINNGGVLEVNPIDFIAIEAIRLFVPEFYSFMRSRKNIFTMNDKELEYVGSGKDFRKLEIENGLSRCSDDYRESTRKLIKQLFPYVDNSLKGQNVSYDYSWQKTWGKQLKICSIKNFDSYFTGISGGDEEELSQLEIEKILESTKSKSKFEKVVKEHIENRKIRKLLQTIQYSIDEENPLPLANIKNIITVLFDTSDNLIVNESEIGMFDIGNDMESMRVIYQIFQSEKNKNTNFEILEEIIPKSKGLFGPVQEVSLLSKSSNKEESSEVPEEKIPELENLALDKILKWKNKILDHKKFLYILYRWKDWDPDKSYESYIKDILKNRDKTLKFLRNFISVSKVTTMGDYGSRTEEHFNYKSLADFVDIDDIKKTVLTIKSSKSSLYKKYKEVIDIFLKDFDNREITS